MVSAVDNQSGRVEFEYDAQGNLTISRVKKSASSSGPTAITTTVTYYAYDANGNNTSGDGRTLTYTVFNKLETVTKNGHSTTFDYGPDRSRYKRTDTKADKTTTVLYIGSVEKMTHPDGRQEVKRILAAATLGGTASELTGGKFANGALTGAFSRAFSDNLLEKSKSEEEIISEMIQLAEEGKLSFNVPDGYEWEYRDTTAAIKDCGHPTGCKPVEGVSSGHEGRALAVTSPRENYSVYYRGSAKAGMTEIHYTIPGKENEIIYLRVPPLDAYETAAFTIGHEIDGHLNYKVNGRTTTDERKANFYGFEALKSYRRHRDGR